MKKYRWLSVLLLLISSTTLAICLFLLATLYAGNDKNKKGSDIEYQKEDSTSMDASNTTLDKIDFQTTLDEWVSNTAGSKGVYIYDLDLGEGVGSYNSDEEFQTASIYKLFVVYEGYRRIESGEWKPNDLIGFTGYTVFECLDLAIRESNSECAETMWDEIGAEKMQTIINTDFNLENTDLENFVSTPKDVVEMMKIFYYHEALNNSEYLAQIKDSFLNQPVTMYDWRQGLPSGFDVAMVYNKVGWGYDDVIGYWNIYNDAAIIEFLDQNRHYAIAVMTSGVPHYQISKLGQMLEEKFFNMY